ncbi:MAG: DEAD/DEAH box helicase [Bacteroidales bacterium]|nr:DEAD/DEAH box helicase [Bacteroidales bacterium]
MTFSQLGIDEPIVRALEANKITRPTDIQTKAIPHILQNNRDLVAIAQTGTGKTAAFCLPILQNIDLKSSHIQALVLVPTRELGQQVAREFFLFSKFMPRVFTEAVYGGSPIAEQMAKLKRSTHVVVATPGRLLDLLERNALTLAHLRYVVMDEADEMINMGFKDEIDRVLEQCPKQIRKLLFTATMPADVKQLIHDYLQSDFVEIRINASEKVNENITHHFTIYPKGQKLEVLKSYLLERKEQRGIVFCQTKLDAKRLAKQLAGFAVTADAIHGNLNQEMREKVMRGFKKNRINLLVATDIAARGLDVKDLDYIVHYDLPEKPEQYTHRSGRTARAGQTGDSICFVRQEEMREIKQLEEKLDIQFSELHVSVKVDKQPSPSITIYLNMGYVQGFDDKSLKEYLVEEAGMDAANISGIVVDDEHSHFVVSQKYEQQIFLNLKGIKLSHRNLKLWIKE